MILPICPKCFHHHLEESECVTTRSYKPFEKYVDRNIAEQPVEIESDRHRERLMREKNLMVRPREHVDDLNQRRYNIGLPPVRK